MIGLYTTSTDMSSSAGPSSDGLSLLADVSDESREISPERVHAHAPPQPKRKKEMAKKSRVSAEEASDIQAAQHAHAVSVDGPAQRTHGDAESSTPHSPDQGEEEEGYESDDSHDDPSYVYHGPVDEDTDNEGDDDETLSEREQLEHGRELRGEERANELEAMAKLPGGLRVALAFRSTLLCFRFNNTARDCLLAAGVAMPVQELHRLIMIVSAKVQSLQGFVTPHLHTILESFANAPHGKVVQAFDPPVFHKYLITVMCMKVVRIVVRYQQSTTAMATPLSIIEDALHQRFNRGLGQHAVEHLQESLPPQTPLQLCIERALPEVDRWIQSITTNGTPESVFSAAFKEIAQWNPTPFASTRSASRTSDKRANSFYDSQPHQKLPLPAAYRAVSVVGSVDPSTALPSHAHDIGFVKTLFGLHRVTYFADPRVANTRDSIIDAFAFALQQPNMNHLFARGDTHTVQTATRKLKLLRGTTILLVHNGRCKSYRGNPVGLVWDSYITTAFLEYIFLTRIGGHTNAPLKFILIHPSLACPPSITDLRTPDPHLIFNPSPDDTTRRTFRYELSFGNKTIRSHRVLSCADIGDGKRAMIAIFKQRLVKANGEERLSKSTCMKFVRDILVCGLVSIRIV